MFRFPKFKWEIHIPLLILNIHLWYKCDYSAIIHKITEINLNYFNEFYLKIQNCDYYFADCDYGVIIFLKFNSMIVMDYSKVYILFALGGN